jgi:hypothetical protein
MVRPAARRYQQPKHRFVKQADIPSRNPLGGDLMRSESLQRKREIQQMYTP